MRGVTRLTRSRRACLDHGRADKSNHYILNRDSSYVCLVRPKDIFHCMFDLSVIRRRRRHRRRRRARRCRCGRWCCPQLAWICNNKVILSEQIINFLQINHISEGTHHSFEANNWHSPKRSYVQYVRTKA